GLHDAEGLGLIGAREAVQGHRVLAHHQFGVQHQLGAMAGGGQGLRSGADEIAHPADLQHQGVQVDAGHTAGQGCDHHSTVERVFDQVREVEPARARRALRSASAQTDWALVRAPPVASSATGPGPRHSWVRAMATASAASAGRGGASSFSSLTSMAWICFLSARPLPVTAAFTSEGVCIAIGVPRSAASRIAIPEARAVPLTAERVFWLHARPTATPLEAARLPLRIPRSAAPRLARPETWALPVPVEVLFWLHPRSPAPTPGECSSAARRNPPTMASSR